MMPHPRADILYESINALFGAWEQQNGINPTEKCALMSLYPDKRLNQKEICEKYKVPKQTVSYIAASLQKEGYVEAAPDERDGRAKIIALTDKGRAYAQGVLGPIMELNLRIYECMGRRKFDQLISALENYRDAIGEEVAVHDKETRRKR